MEIDSDVDSRFLDGSHQFLDWFRSLPGATFHQDIAIEDLRGRSAGRGIVAKADIEPDTVLFTIPRTSILCAATSPLKNLIPDVFDLDNQDADFSDDDDNEKEDDSSSPSQNSWTLLILMMIYEHLRGDASPWKPYLDILPATFNTPMFWTDSELSELQASALVAKVGKADADMMIASKILPVIRAHSSIFFPSGASSLNDDQLTQLAHRMGSTIMAYAFDLEQDIEIPEEGIENDDEWEEDREGKTMLGMVPMADILNADAEFNAHINHGADVLEAVSLRPIKAGEEILNFYGPLSNAELLRRYGYVTEKHARWDVVELPWDLVEQLLKERFPLREGEWEKVQERLRSDDDEFEEGFVLERSSPDPLWTGHFDGPAVFDHLPEELTEQFKLCLKAIKKVTEGRNILAARALDDKGLRKEIFFETVLKAILTRESQYSTKLQEDEQLLNTPGQITDERQRMAVWMRRGEKQILKEAQTWIRQELETIRNKASQQEDDGRAAKRRRA
ncbi:hypothetical protein QBC35DRAFT_506158 [Podospora australis]|uniref:SET domain-containing protein n=1 Tax=Podospora australis TaxID=1536484 RepID=A0AAN7AF53_9PEZI|nr:hypothetical protein QBC35DRAFT_506158 [Podospora australis]